MKKNGIHTEFYENRKKEYEGTYSDGRKLSVENGMKMVRLRND
jgi:antitoxin component YwqK of YwqJK toxin-antitoxin module